MDAEILLNLLDECQKYDVNYSNKKILLDNIPFSITIPVNVPNEVELFLNNYEKKYKNNNNSYTFANDYIFEHITKLIDSDIDVIENYFEIQNRYKEVCLLNKKYLGVGSVEVYREIDKISLHYQFVFDDIPNTILTFYDETKNHEEIVFNHDGFVNKITPPVNIKVTKFDTIKKSISVSFNIIVFYDKSKTNILRHNININYKKKNINLDYKTIEEKNKLMNTLLQFGLDYLKTNTGLKVTNILKEVEKNKVVKLYYTVTYKDIARGIFYYDLDTNMPEHDLLITENLEEYKNKLFKIKEFISNDLSGVCSRYEYIK